MAEPTVEELKAALCDLWGEAGEYVFSGSLDESTVETLNNLGFEIEDDFDLDEDADYD